MLSIFIIVLIILSAAMILIFAVRRLKIQIHVDLVWQNGQCFIESQVKWHSFTLLRKNGQVDLSTLDSHLKIISDQEKNASDPENQDTEFSWTTAKELGSEFISMLGRFEKIVVHTTIRAGCYEPEHTAYMAAFLYLIKNTVIPCLKHHQQVLDLSLQIEPEFRQPDFSLKIQSMILLLPGQAIRIIRGMNQARRDGLK